MLNSILSTPVTTVELLICLGSAIVLGLLAALVFLFRSRKSTSFALTLAALPAAMTMIVMMVNGNLGIAVAVAGSFALVRFRSIAGNGREITGIFTVMTIGLLCGMGYVTIACMFFAIMAALILVLTFTNFGGSRFEKTMKVTFPEDYDYDHVLDEVFESFHVKADVIRVKTTNLGSLVDVTYRIRMQEDTVSKKLLDAVRARNANLEVVISSGDRESRETL